MDWEFSGWVAPIANRLGGGVRLYADGLHSPMAPLPFLLVYAVSGGHATWLTESRAILVTQGISVLVLYLGLLRRLPRPIPFLAAFFSIPVFLMSAKTIYYDAIVQALVASTAVVAACLATRSDLWRGAVRPGLPPVVRPALIGGLSALAILAKQSTGIGLTFGVALLLALAGPIPWGRRFVRPATYLLLTAGFVVLFSVMISPWVDLRGMARDVFLTGSEPKGGVGRMLTNLQHYSVEVVQQIIVVAAIGVGLLGFLRTNETAGDRTGPIPEPSIEPQHPFRLCLAAIAAPICVACLCVFAPRWAGRLVPGGPIDAYLDTVRTTVLWSGLISLMVLSARQFTRRRASDGDGQRDWFVAMFVILFSAAVFHSLSVPTFRWTYDGNPLNTVAIAAFLIGLFRTTSRGRPATARPRAFAALIVVFLLSGAMWAAFSGRVQAARLCTEEWTEVAFLKGARLRKASDGMRGLVERVRKLAPDARADTVLLLPNDPNVEAWFERPRPPLSCAIAFTDQYWARYVDSDFERLLKAPPKVIVIGPRDTWRGFQSQWNRGCEQLIDRVQSGLLPERYRAVSPQAIRYGFGTDVMDIYVRVDDNQRTGRHEGGGERAWSAPIAAMTSGDR